MNTIEFWNGKRFEVAEHLGELSQEEFIKAIQITSQSELEVDHIKAELLELILPISIQDINLENEGTLSGFLQLMSLTDPFINEDFETGKWSRELSFSEFPITKLECKDWDQMRCPGDLLNRLSFGQYKNVISAIKMIQLNPEDKSLFCLLMACLFVDTNKPEEWSDHFKDIDEIIMFSVYWIVAANLDFLSKNEIYIDGESIDLGVLFATNTQSEVVQKNNLGLNRVLFQLAESSVFSSIKDVENTPFLQVMLRLLDLKLRADDTE